MKLYVLIYVLIYISHIFYFPVNVVFYSALFDAFISVLIIILVLKMQYFSIFDKFNKLLILLLLTIFGYSISISIPTVIDRSLSFYTLEKINQRGGGIKLSSFENIFKHEYMDEYKVAEARITEQLQSGTIVINNGCVRLTKRGERIARISLFFRKNLLPKRRLIMGKYTDDLTNPYRDSKKEFDYACN